MKKLQLDLIYKGICEYAKNHKGENPIAIILHIDKKEELHNEIGLLYCNSAVQFDPAIGSFFIFGVKVWFSQIIERDWFVLSEVAL